MIPRTPLELAVNQLFELVELGHFSVEDRDWPQARCHLQAARNQLDVVKSHDPDPGKMLGYRDVVDDLSVAIRLPTEGIEVIF